VARTLVSKGLTIRGILVGSREMFVKMNRAIEHHKIKPVIDKVFHFDQAIEAYKYFQSQRHVGKVVIRVTKEA